RAREVAHRSAFVPLVTEDPGRMLQHARQLAVKPAVHGFSRIFPRAWGPSRTQRGAGRPDFCGFQAHIWSDANVLPNVRSGTNPLSPRVASRVNFTRRQRHQTTQRQATAMISFAGL